MSTGSRLKKISHIVRRRQHREVIGLKNNMPQNKAKSSRPRLQSIKRKVDTIDLSRGSAAVKRIVGRKLQRIRDRILLRDEYTCQNPECGRVTVDLMVDHIVPLHLGGQESDANRQCLCSTCHDLKSEAEGKERG